MLVISRKTGQSLKLGADIEITVLRVEGDQVRIGVSAPRSVAILRGELWQEIQAETKAANTAASPKADLSALKQLSKRIKTQTPQDAPTPKP
jgi:carbon storage regulator